MENIEYWFRVVVELAERPLWKLAILLAIGIFVWRGASRLYDRLLTSHDRSNTHHLATEQHGHFGARHNELMARGRASERQKSSHYYEFDLQEVAFDFPGQERKGTVRAFLKGYIDGDLILESKEDGQQKYLDVSDTAFMQVLRNLSDEYETAKRKEVGFMKAGARKAASVETGAQ